MQSTYLTKTFKTAVLAVTILLLGAGASFAQSVGLTAQPLNATLPDGQAVPMWGYTCGAVSSATCAPLNSNAAGGWSPVVITVAPGPLTINLTNSLPGTVPTSIVIVGQLGGGLGATPMKDSASAFPHGNQGTTWPISGSPDVPGGDPTFNPPAQPDRVRSFATEVNHGATTALQWASLNPGTYLIESGTHPSIQGPMGLYGILVVTTAGSPGTAYPAVGALLAVTYTSDVPLLLSEIDPVQNAAVANAVITTGFLETNVWSGQPGGCGNKSNADGTPNASYGNCYPPAVNYDPRYYLVNGVAFDKTNAGHSVFPATTATPVSGTVLVRLVNAGLRMHVPSIVGAVTGGASGFSLIAEDGNRLPGTPRVQSEVFMAAGKTYDVMINAVAGTDLPIFDRQLSLSTNNLRDGGMQAYINAGGTVPAFSGATAKANPDSYFVVSGNTLTVSDPG
ncbi:MAG TPA: hypothetical protein VGF08_13320, partial [Terriglobales bacterium]